MNSDELFDYGVTLMKAQAMEAKLSERLKDGGGFPALTIYFKDGEETPYMKASDELLAAIQVLEKDAELATMLKDLGGPEFLQMQRDAEQLRTERLALELLCSDIRDGFNPHIGTDPDFWRQLARKKLNETK